VNYLLDTQVLLWWFMQPKRIGAKAMKRLENRQSAVWYSSVSLWEIEIKRSLGKLRAPDDLLDVASSAGFCALSLAPSHALGLRELPVLHSDPFDRILVAQARAEGLVLVTADEQVRRYPVSTLEA
jgi:PIN domain nuclease of toxin-antitoxin system